MSLRCQSDPRTAKIPEIHRRKLERSVANAGSTLLDSIHIDLPCFLLGRRGAEKARTDADYRELE